MARTVRITDFHLALELLKRGVRVVGQSSQFVDFDDTNLRARFTVIDIRLEETAAMLRANERMSQRWN